MIDQHASVSVTFSEPDQAIEAVQDRWQRAAVAGMVASAAALGATGAVDLCTESGSFLLALAWLILPALTIAAVGVVATVTDRSVDRWLASVLGLALTVLWVGGLVWASVGEALNQTMC